MHLERRKGRKRKSFVVIVYPATGPSLLTDIMQGQEEIQTHAREEILGDLSLGLPLQMHLFILFFWEEFIRREFVRAF